MNVTITKCKKKGKSFLVETNNSSNPIKMHQELVFFYGLREKKSLTPETWLKIQDENEMKLAWNYAMNILSARSYTEFQLLKKLKAKEVKQKIQEYILTEAKRLNLINDVFFAKQYALELHNKGFGIKALKVKMQQKGIPSELIEKTLLELDESLSDITPAKNIFDKKLNFLKRKEADTRKLKEKMYRFMISKGFPYDTISDLLDNIK